LTETKLFAEPTKIVKHPKSQTAKEGTKVELKCKVEGKRANLLYQWFKDDVAVIGQNCANLVLEAVELKDFGRYTCYVSYPDAFGEGEKSSPATLDVIPQNLNGMSEYCLFFLFVMCMSLSLLKIEVSGIMLASYCLAFC